MPWKHVEAATALLLLARTEWEVRWAWGTQGCVTGQGFCNGLKARLLESPRGSGQEQAQLLSSLLCLKESSGSLCLSFPSSPLTGWTSGPLHWPTETPMILHGHPKKDAEVLFL